MKSTISCASVFFALISLRGFFGGGRVYVKIISRVFVCVLLLLFQFLFFVDFFRLHERDVRFFFGKVEIKIYIKF